MSDWAWYVAGVATTIVVAFIGGYIARHRDPRHRKYGFDFPASARKARQAQELIREKRKD